MEKDHLIEDIREELTANDVIQSEISTDTIGRMIDRAVDLIAPWYQEKTAETVTATRSGTGYYISSFTYTPDHIINVWPASLRAVDIGDFDAALLGLESRILDISDMEEYAAWEILKPMLRKAWDTEIRWRWIDSKLFIHGTLPDDLSVTVEYARLVTEFSHITWKKALNWVREYSYNRSLRALGRVRGKYRGGGITFETDASDLVAEANEKIDALVGQLPTLQFNYCVRR